MRLPIICLALLTLSVAIGRADRATYDDTKTQTALPLDTPPVIDGVIDPAEWGRASSWSITVDPNLADGIRGGANGDGAVNPPASNDDLSFQIFVGYDTNNLYIAVRVTDDVIQVDSAEADSPNGTTWMDDSVEVFIDGDNSNLDTRDTSGTNPEVVGTGGQFVITANNAYREMEAGSPGYGESAAWFAKTTVTATGYEAEFRISLKTIGDPKPGDIIGFTVGVNDDDDGAGGERQVMWVGLPHTEATYGNLVIGGKPYSAPKTSAPTIDGVINPAEYAGATEIKVNPFTAVYDLGAGDDTFETNDLLYSAWIVYDADAIYVAVNVTDDKVVHDTSFLPNDLVTWEDDSVEIFFDADYDREAGNSAAAGEGQYVVTSNGTPRSDPIGGPFHVFGTNDDWFAATSTNAGGYQVEFKVKKSALRNPPDGATLGFHIAVNDDDGDTTLVACCGGTGTGRKAQVGWSGHAHNEYTYGSLTLLSASLPPPGGKLTIQGIKVNGDKLEFSITNPSTTGTHVVQQTSTIVSPTWTDVPNVTFSSGPGGTVVATFPKPTNSPVFYQVAVK